MDAVNAPTDEDMVYGFDSDEVDHVLEFDAAQVLETSATGSPSWDVEQVDAYGVFEVYHGDLDSGEYAAWDGRRLVEAEDQQDLFDVIDAYNGETRRLHEEDEEYKRVSDEVAAAEVVRIWSHDTGVVAYGVEVGDEEGELTVAATGEVDDLREIEENLHGKEHVIFLGDDVEIEDGWLYATAVVEEGEYMRAVGASAEASGSDEVTESPPPAVSLDVSYDDESDEATVLHEGGDHVDELRVYVDGEVADSVEDVQAGDSLTVPVSEGDEVRATVVDGERETGTKLGVYHPEDG